MADKIPFDDDVMTLIMGLGGPDEPGQHGRSKVPMPEQKAVDLIMQIRDLCDEYLRNADKQDEDEEEKPGDAEDAGGEDEDTEEGE